jgi:hypothetical protein
MFCGFCRIKGDGGFKPINDKVFGLLIPEVKANIQSGVHPVAVGFIDRFKEYLYVDANDSGHLGEVANIALVKISDAGSSDSIKDTLRR